MQEWIDRKIMHILTGFRERELVPCDVTILLQM